jgi:hypothetical protein
MLHTRSNADTIMPGERILLGTLTASRRDEQNRFHADFAIVTVDGLDDGYLTGTEENGDSVRIDTRHGNAGDGRRILWSVPLPEGPEDMVRRFCTVALEGGDIDGALFLVESVEGDVATARFVTSPTYAEMAARKTTPADGTSLAPTGTKGNAVFAGTVRLHVPLVRQRDPVSGRMERFPKTEKAAWTAGDLVACVDYSCAFVDGAMTYTPSECVVVGNFADDAALGRFLPATPPPRHGVFASRDPGPGAYWKRDHEEGLARVALEPDEGLVLAYGHGGEHPYPACSVLGSSGLTFHVESDVTTTLAGVAPGNGLWVIEEAKHWGHRYGDGEYETGIGGKWRPATREDFARFGLTERDVELELADAFDMYAKDMDQQVDRYIALAEEAHLQAQAAPVTP